MEAVQQQHLRWYRAAEPALYILILLCAVIGAFVYKLRFEGIFACPASGYGSNNYLSDCQANAYGDYDHGAFWFGLEPQARRAASEADVLFVGSSRLQLALSGAIITKWFSTSAIRHYLLGFSHSETVMYMGPLLSKIHPRAKVYVVNVDRFFDDRVSPPTAQILRGSDILSRYRAKQIWQSLHKPLCTALPAVCGGAVAVYRTRDTGAWQMKGAERFEAKAVSDGLPSDTERWDQYAGLGEKFLAQLPVDRSCVLLTIVPTVATKRAEAMAIAARLGLELLTPRLDGLRTFDGSHLDEASAQRWSAAFLQEVGPRIRNCVAGAPASTR